MKVYLLAIMALVLTASGCSNEYKMKSTEKKYIAELLEICAAGDGVSCYELAAAAETVKLGAHVYKAQPNIDVRNLYQTAITHLELECVSSNADSCRVAGDFYQKMGHKRNSWEKDYYPSHSERINPQTGKHQTARWSLSKGYKKDREIAAEYYRKACHLSDANGCKDLASALSKPPVEDLKASQNAYTKAVELYLSDCAAGVERHLSCDRAPHILVYRINSPQSIQQGLELYKKGCNEGYPRSCFNVGSIYRDDRFSIKNFSESKKYFQKSCDLEKREDCKIIQNLEETQ